MFSDATLSDINVLSQYQLDQRPKSTVNKQQEEQLEVVIA